MSTTPSANSVATLGIETLLTGFTILNETIDDSDISVSIPDSKGATVDEKNVDTKYDLNITFYGAGTLPVIGVSTFSYASAKWKVDKISKSGTYNDFQKYSLTAHRFTNYPAQS